MNCYFCGLNLIPDHHNPTAMRCPDTKCQGYGFAIKQPVTTPTPETDSASGTYNHLGQFTERNAIYYRLRAGWSVEKTLSTPVAKHKS